MSLNWNVSKVKDYKNVCFIDGRINPVTEALIFFPHICEITDRNWKEVYMRVRTWERVGGPFLHVLDGDEDKPCPITAKDVHAHIGLTTNWTPVTQAAFAKDLLLYAQRQASYGIEQVEKDLALEPAPAGA